MSIFNQKLRGFTLIEILVVIAIIGILAAIGFGSFGAAQAKARDARRMSDLENTSRALELYYNDNSEYPASSGGAIVGVAWGARWADGTTLYMEKVPKDTKFDYYYESIDGGAAYRLFAQFENQQSGSDNFAGTDKVYQGYDGSIIDGCANGCNYYVRSTNAPAPTATTAPAAETEVTEEEVPVEPDCDPNSQDYEQCMQESIPYDPCNDPQSEEYNDCRT